MPGNHTVLSQSIHASTFSHTFSSILKLLIPLLNPHSQLITLLSRSLRKQKIPEQAFWGKPLLQPPTCMCAQIFRFPCLYKYQRPYALVLFQDSACVNLLCLLLQYFCALQVQRKISNSDTFTFSQKIMCVKYIHMLVKYVPTANSRCKIADLKLQSGNYYTLGLYGLK